MELGREMYSQNCFIKETLMNLTDSRYKDFALVKEMLETADVIRNFDFSQTANMAKAIEQTGAVFLTGEGSSRIFPAKSFIYGVLKRGLPIAGATDGSFQGCEYGLSRFAVMGASNSGKTKELITLIKQLKAKGQKNIFGVTANAGTPLQELSDECVVLSCGKEDAVAATKSVVEQALVYRSILCNLIKCCECEANKTAAADLSAQIMTTEYDPAIIEKAANARTIFFAGRNDGVAEELTLKTNEITRKQSDFLEGTYALHGVEEIMRENDVIFFVEPFESEFEKMQSIFEKNVGCTVVALSTKDTPFPTIKLPELKGYEKFFQLMAGWNLLVQIGTAEGINLDKPNRARKIGNEFIG